LKVRVFSMPNVARVRLVAAGKSFLAIWYTTIFFFIFSSSESRNLMGVWSGGTPDSW